MGKGFSSLCDRACPTINFAGRFINAVWRNIPKPKIQMHDDGFSVILFQPIADRDNVVQGGPYTTNGKPILLKKWPHSFNLHDELRIALLWVRMPRLPVLYWGAQTLSRLASTIGVPLFVDDCTTKESRVLYARVLIDVDVTKHLPSMFKYTNQKGILVE